MITRQQRKWLEGLEITPEGKLKRDGAKFAVYMGRIQKRIDKELAELLWLAEKYPAIFLDEEREWKDSNGKVIPHRRWRAILKAIKFLHPEIDIEFIKKVIESPEPPETM